MTSSRRRSLLRLLAPAVWTAVILAAGAALWSPANSDPDLSPLNLTVSDFAALDRGGPLETTMGLLGVVSLGLLVTARVRRVPLGGLPSLLLALWAAGLVVAALVPTDPLSTDLSGPAYVHRYASVVAFAALPAAGLLLARRLATGEGHGATARLLRVLSWAALLGAAVMAYSAGPGGRELIGLVERLLLGCEVVMLGVLGHYVHRDAHDEAGHRHAGQATRRHADEAGHRHAGQVTRRHADEAGHRHAGQTARRRADDAGHLHTGRSGHRHT